MLLCPNKHDPGYLVPEECCWFYSGPKGISERDGRDQGEIGPIMGLWLLLGPSLWAMVSVARTVLWSLYTNILMTTMYVG